MQVLVLNYLKSGIKLMNVNTYIHLLSYYRKMAWPKKRRYECTYDDVAKRSFSLAREEEEAFRNFDDTR